jgi:DNA-binding MarR family transcriptional regulator
MSIFTVTDRQSEPVTVGALGARLWLDSGTLNPLHNRMETAVFITRTRDPNDECRVLITLTHQGRKLWQHVLRVPETLAVNISSNS